MYVHVCLYIYIYIYIDLHTDLYDLNFVKNENDSKSLDEQMVSWILHNVSNVR